jgi:ADP-ribose pyrophosphatase
LPATGSFDEAVHLFCGRVDSRGATGIYGLAAEQEDIRVTVKTLAEIETMLDAGQIDSAHTLISLYWLLRHRGRLRKEWGVTPAAAS